MAPKKAAARSGPAAATKRPIKGPSQAFRSPTVGQPVGRVQSLVASMAGDPAALSRFAAEMDGFLQHCSTRSSVSGRPPPSATASSPVSPSSSEDGREGSSSGALIVDPQLAQSPDLPVVRGRSRRSGGPTRRAAGKKGPFVAPARRRTSAQPPAEVASGSGLSLVVSPQSASAPSLLNPDSESSIEDSLPVPARKSSGGKRRHRRTSRKRAKRRKDDTSSSYSGTSSSSSDDEGNSMELYWGFGESVSGLPRWAWERRANTHRAKYGATQEYRDGVLVPDVKVSTNSARDIIPGSHLSAKLRSRILNGRYVDMFKLLPPSEEQEKGSSSAKKRSGASAADRTFEHWLDCFQVFAGVVTAAYPRRSLHLIVYLSIVRSAFTKAGEKAAIKYDENFRRRAARIPSARWDRKDLDVWTTYVAPLIDKKVPDQQKSRISVFRPGRRLLCWDFNRGSCQRPACRFAHSCEKCNGSHPASSCFGGRRPFRGGRGGSQQPPKSAPLPSTSGTGK
ncbi:XP_034954535.1uncharacterized protein LOC118076098 [Podarcis lilfordi]|uniref:XP_034954535.1uncharacterized protein LOC118076098 n=1 Tax=Podarcis lilfordi TaxID=74358 RepID=A0AA35JPT7_9SAUR|nr:XP_034954535.1uncharacterized protein LOC118076098 [Podarcis lilfordi]